MKSLMLLAAAVTSGAGPQYHFDLARYFYATPSVEAAHRAELLGQVNGFLQQPASSLDTPAALSQWLATYDSLVERRCSRVPHPDTCMSRRQRASQACKAARILSSEASRLLTEAMLEY